MLIHAPAAIECVVEKVDDGVNISVAAEQFDFAAADGFPEGGALDRVEIVEFDPMGPQTRDFGRRFHHLLDCFAGDSQDDVSTCFEASPVTSLHCIDHRLVVMSAIHPIETGGVDRLHPKIERNVAFFTEVIDQIEDFVGDAIGARPNRQTDNFGEVDHRAIQFLQLIDWGISVRGRLKVGDKTADAAIAFTDRLDSVLELFEDGFESSSAAGAE